MQTQKNDTQQHKPGPSLAHPSEPNGNVESHQTIKLQVTDYLMGSACDMVEHHVTALDGVHSAQLNRVSGQLLISYDPC